MNDEDLKKILFTLLLLKNRTKDDEEAQGFAYEAIRAIENHFGIDRDEIHQMLNKE